MDSPSSSIYLKSIRPTRTLPPPRGDESGRLSIYSTAHVHVNSYHLYMIGFTPHGHVGFH